MLMLYVIKSCDTCRKARKALDDKGLAYRVHDLREDGLSAGLLEELLERVALLTLLNKRSTTWRNLSDAEKASSGDGEIRKLLLTHPTLIKRPVLDTGEEIRVGYRDGDYDDLQG